MAQLKNSGVKSCEELLTAFRKSETKPYGAEKIVFGGTNGKDVYNITAPFEDEGEPVIAGRVEHRDSEDSEIRFFVNRGGEWVMRDGSPVFSLQDPFHTRIAGELIVGGVQTYPHPTMEGRLGWRTVFYRGSGLTRLEPFFQGPDFMKDLRLVQLRDGSIGVFTRPQGEKGGRGKIGFTRVHALDDLTTDVVSQAPLLNGQFLDDEWGGCNEIHLLSSGLLGVLGHIARFDEAGNRHYYPMVFVFDPETETFTDMQIIAERANFLQGPSKRPDLEDVVFSGGLVRRPGGIAELYAGVSDAEAHKITIRDPFAGFDT
ncbi:DUF1861 family protein [Paenibacillus thermoaerophilus]|uniref:DUF1861 family protein n=1 Tax=Paenibacillus thermoaerophilus TaxID=1215385 RepID=A0ABW2V006_9BACL|nr:DUF1861 family protein [Paenibacillus thermoaerophilus]TMV18254.1 DUF1861 family protein [Paenibacillus thermoaerophilus]